MSRQESIEFLSGEDNVSIQPDVAMLDFTKQQMKLLKQLDKLNDCTRQQLCEQVLNAATFKKS